MEMRMSNKVFVERLNKELDNIDVPQNRTERIEVLSKLLKIPRFKAEAILQGSTRPEEDLLSILAKELEVSVDWLLGNSEMK